MKIKYTIIDQNDELIKACHNEINAIKEAKKAVEKYPEDQIFVHWFRADDGQAGFLNRNGHHEITGKAW